MSEKNRVKQLRRGLITKGQKTSEKLTSMWSSWYVMVVESVPFLIAVAVFLSVVSLKSPVLLFCLLLGSLLGIVIQRIGQGVNLAKPWVVFCQILAVSLVLSLFWLDYFAFPAQAQFFGKAESFFRNTLTQGTETNSNTQTAVSLIFNVLRAIYLLYIAVSLVGVINAVRKDEDWQSIARVPLLVVVAVTVADVLTGFVVGD
jgi:flagellar biosynthesis protein FlhB